MSRRSFWPTVLLGVAGAGLAAIAGHQPWVAVHSADGTPVGTSALDRPEVTSVALAALALWGVLLVTRGVVRRAVAVAAAVAAIALAALAVHGIVASGHPQFSWMSFSRPTTTSRNAWGPIATLGAIAAAVAALLAVWQAPGWPEMGRKYDAPTGPTAPVAPLEEQSALDVWKAMDEGIDPTADRSE